MSLALAGYLLLGVFGCRTGAPPEPPAAPAVDPTEVLLAPTLLADLAVPEHPDLVLGAMEPAPAPSGWWPAPSAGRWAAYRVWSSSRDRDWRATDVQLWHDTSASTGHEREQLRAVGDALEAFSAQRLGEVGPGWGVIAARSSGQADFAPLTTAELWVAPHGTVFHSAWVASPVTVELVGLQEITVPAGTFKALRVRRNWGQGTRTTDEHAWWTAEHGLVASVLRVQTVDTPESRLVVLAAEGSGPRDALRQVLVDQRAAVGLKP